MPRLGCMIRPLTPMKRRRGFLSRMRVRPVVRGPSTVGFCCRSCRRSWDISYLADARSRSKKMKSYFDDSDDEEAPPLPGGGGMQGPPG